MYSNIALPLGCTFSLMLAHCCKSHLLILYFDGLSVWLLILCVFSYYVAAPLSLCSNIAPEVARFVGSQVAEFIASGKSHSHDFNLLLSISHLMKLGSLQWIGGAIFLWGWIHQRRCHAILVSSNN